MGNTTQNFVAKTAISAYRRETYKRRILCKFSARPTEWANGGGLAKMPEGYGALVRVIVQTGLRLGRAHRSRRETPRRAWWKNLIFFCGPVPPGTAAMSGIFLRKDQVSADNSDLTA